MSDQTVKYDVVIVGAGFAGSLMAFQLGQAGKKVLLLEAGNPLESKNREEYMETFFTAMAKTPEAPYPQNFNAPRPSTLDIKRVNQTTDVIEDCSDPVKSITKNGYFIEKGPMPFGSTYERVAGGTTWHWLGTCLRMLPNDFKLQSMYNVGVDWPISYEDLSPYYDKAEFEIGVSANIDEQMIHGITFTPGYKYPMQKIPFSLLDQKFADGLNGLQLDGNVLQVTGTPAGRNSISNKINGVVYNNGRRLCQGNTNCVPICPVQAKYDATITLSKALNTGNVDIMYKTVAYNVLMDETTKKISGIEYKQYEDKQGPVTGSGTVSGTSYVIAAHAIEAAKLLLMSTSQLPAGIANSSGTVGKYLMDHPVKLSWGLMPESTFPYRGPISTAGIETTRDGDFRKDRAAYRIEIGNEGWSWPAGGPYTQLNDLINNGVVGTELRKEIAATFTRQFRVGFLMEQLPDEKSCIVPSATCKDNLGIPRPEIHYDLPDYTKKGFEAAMEATAIIFKKLGVTEFSLSEAEMEKRGGYFQYNGTSYFSEGAGHVLGTHRMGSDPKQSVTDGNMRSWDHDNLYVVGCGSFPTTATSNPSLTLMALAFKATDALLKEL